MSGNPLIFQQPQGEAAIPVDGKVSASNINAVLASLGESTPTPGKSYSWSDGNGSAYNFLYNATSDTYIVSGDYGNLAIKAGDETQSVPPIWSPPSFTPTDVPAYNGPLLPVTDANKNQGDTGGPLTNSTKAIDNAAKAPRRKSIPTRFDKMEETIGGADLLVWYFQEIPNAQDLKGGVPLELCRKEILVMEFDSVMSVSYSTIREKFPVRALGLVNPKKYTDGIRTVSGHIAFSVFTNDVLTRLRGRVAQEVEKAIDPSKAGKIVDKTQLTSKGTVTPSDRMARQEFKSMLLDQLPPFHLLIMGTNERGVMSRMLLKDVTILDENQNQGTQQPNIVNKSSFVAIDLVPMTQSVYDETLLTGSLTAIEESYVGGNYGSSSGNDITGSGLMLEMYYDSIKSNNNIRGQQ